MSECPILGLFEVNQTASNALQGDFWHLRATEKKKARSVAVLWLWSSEFALKMHERFTKMK